MRPWAEREREKQFLFYTLKKCHQCFTWNSSIEMTGTMFKKQKKNLCPTATCGNRSPLLTVEGSRPADLSVAPCSRLDQARAAFSQSTFTFCCWVKSIDHTADYHTWTTLKTLLQRAERRTDTHLHSPAHRMKCFKDKSATAAFIKTKLENFCKTKSIYFTFF